MNELALYILFAALIGANCGGLIATFLSVAWALYKIKMLEKQVKDFTKK